MSTEVVSDDELVFSRGHAGSGGVWLIVAGAAGLVLAAVGFVVAVRGRVDTLALHSMTTFPTLLSIGALTAGWRMLKTPSRVASGRDGLTVETRQGARLLRWDEVGCAAVETAGTSHRRCLNLTDVDGKSLLKLDQSFDRFDEMAAAISRRVEAKGDGTSLRIFQKKARRQGALAFTLGLFLTSACVFVAWDTHASQRAARLLKEKGQPGEAEVVRRFVAPNGVTKRLEYRVAGAGVTNVEVETALWNGLEGVRTVPVIYVPGEPGISRLAFGEIREEDFIKTPAGGYGLAAVGGALALFLLVASPFMWDGWDLALDSKTRQWSLKRHGKVVRTFGAPAGPGPRRAGDP